MPHLPRYTVRTSARARRVSLRVSPSGQVEVVAPPGVDAGRIDALVRDHAAWIEKQRARLAKQRALDEAEPLLPREIALRAIGETWRVEYHRADSDRVTLSALPNHCLRIAGASDNVALCQRALRRWLAEVARERLVPGLARLSHRTGLRYARVTIRGQKTRWGSCSSRGTISLNYKLLFLPPALVRHVLLHELCHTREMSHSPVFWAGLYSLSPDAARCRADLRSAWRYLPRWVQAESGGPGSDA
ncbi:MAG: M48 family metallopeptidase [Chloroflexi bacterium]|nr:M48 family metallopeptidase [Chloroflexota bacterium]